MKFTTVSDWLAWQSQLHSQAMDFGLDRIRPVFDKLLQQALAKNIILVGGTNGKGSSCAFLEAIYVAAGYRVGVYTSPHLLQYNERIRVEGEPVSDDLLCQAFDHVENTRQGISLTYFEFGTFAAFDIFQHSNLDVVILEVGLGGRLDVVNLAEPDVSVITNIQLDHTDWLGDTREQIAMEKLGIARANKPLVLADSNPPENVFSIVKNLNVDFKLIHKDFDYSLNQDSWQFHAADKHKHSLPTPGLKGSHQYHNASTALMVTELLVNELPLSMHHIRTGIANCALPGRFQVINQENKMIILDVAHNPHGINAFLDLLQQLPKIGDHKLVFAMLRDKAVADVVALLKPHIDQWYLAEVDVAERALPVNELHQIVTSQQVVDDVINDYASVADAFHQASDKMQAHDKLIVLGSFYTVADVLPLVKQHG